MRYIPLFFALICFLGKNFVFADSNEFKFPKFKSGDKEIVSSDFITNNVVLEFDLLLKVATVKSTVAFKVTEPGYPSLDLVQAVQSLKFDGIEVPTNDLILVTPPGEETKFLYFNKYLEPDKEHVLEFQYNLDSSSMSIEDQELLFGFYFLDVDEDRCFLERYIPSNFEFDSFQMTIDIKIINASIDHQLLANGEIEKIENNHYQIIYPKHFRTSSFFLDIVPNRVFKIYELKFDSIDGKQIPIKSLCVGQYPELIAKKSVKILNDLETKYGPYPHNQLIISCSIVGMEYTGAIVSVMDNEYVLRHELAHQWFGRSTMPVNGNAGWVDEALATFEHNENPIKPYIKVEGSNAAAHTIYRRQTDEKSYGLYNLFSYFAYKAGVREILNMMKNWHDNNKLSSITHEQFRTHAKDSLSNFIPDLHDIFEKYVYGKDLQKEINTFRSFSPSYYIFHGSISMDKRKKYFLKK